MHIYIHVRYIRVAFSWLKFKNYDGKYKHKRYIFAYFIKSIRNKKFNLTN